MPDDASLAAAATSTPRHDKATGALGAKNEEGTRSPAGFVVSPAAALAAVDSDESAEGLLSLLPIVSPPPSPRSLVLPDLPSRQGTDE